MERLITAAVITFFTAVAGLAFWVARSTIPDVLWWPIAIVGLAGFVLMLYDVLRKQ